MGSVPPPSQKALKGINQLKERRHTVKLLWMKDAAKSSSLPPRTRKETSVSLERKNKQVPLPVDFPKVYIDCINLIEENTRGVQ